VKVARRESDRIQSNRGNVDASMPQIEEGSFPSLKALNIVDFNDAYRSEEKQAAPNKRSGDDL
jgi:hypothetical protein